MVDNSTGIAKFYHDNTKSLASGYVVPTNWCLSSTVLYWMQYIYQFHLLRIVFQITLCVPGIWARGKCIHDFIWWFCLWFRQVLRVSFVLSFRLLRLIDYLTFYAGSLYLAFLGLVKVCLFGVLNQTELFLRFSCFNILEKKKWNVMWELYWRGP